MLLLSVAATTSCDDMLTVDTGDKSYENANDTLYSYLGIMKCVQNLAERQVILNEVRGDLTTSTEYVTDTLHAISNFEDPKDGSCTMLNISDYYEVINNCNLYIAHADTSKVKANVKYMLPEYAQVQAVRAWTYLQLVNLYGEVPFIVEPIHNLDVIKNFDYANNQVNKDNLIDKFLELGITRYVDTEYPKYGNYNNGATNIASRLLFIPVRLVIGDMYLLRGASQADYRNAAQYYYDYLRANNSVVTTQYCSAQQLMGTSEYAYGTVNWGAFAGTYSYSTQGEVISLIPSSANKQFGTMLTRVADIFGFTPSSSQVNETSTNDEGTEESESFGAISVNRNYKAQIVPSNGYKALNKAQMYVYWNTRTMNRTYYEEAGDARYNFSTEEFTREGESYTLASKAARGSQFYYSVPIYRKTIVWLRLAEAINRAGFPQIAFAVLKDGLNGDNWPEVTEADLPIVQLDEEGKAVTDEEGNPVYVTDEEGNVVTETTEVVRYDNYGAMEYVSREEFENFFLDFSDEMWLNNYGIHARGCGYGPLVESAASAGRSIKTYVTGNYDEYFAWNNKMKEQGIDFENATKEDYINAVENIICDELALEGAFEGYRFSDLVRMANHKNASGYKGTEWLATKIADRNARKASEDGTVTEITRDESLYSKLQNQNLWYLTKPEWAVK